ncbi:MAG: hypothetical protein ABSA41_01730 [Terriglobia bacterium]
MLFRNLEWIIGLRRVRRFELAKILQISEPAFSSRLAGQRPFTPYEKQRIAEFLGYQADFLFAVVAPPREMRLPQPTRPADPVRILSADRAGGIRA